jgi:hypothetical protein
MAQQETPDAVPPSPESLPPEVRAALEQYGSSLMAWESRDEDAWELLEKWGY